MLIVAISGLTISIKSRKWKVLVKYLNEKCYLKHYQWLSFKYFEFFILNFEVIVKSNFDQDDKFKRYLNGSRMLLENVSIIYKNFICCIQINISRSNLFPLLEIFHKIVRQLLVVFHISGLTLVNNGYWVLFDVFPFVLTVNFVWFDFNDILGKNFSH